MKILNEKQCELKILFTACTKHSYLLKYHVVHQLNRFTFLFFAHALEHHHLDLQPYYHTPFATLL